MWLLYTFRQLFKLNFVILNIVFYIENLDGLVENDNGISSTYINGMR